MARTPQHTIRHGKRRPRRVVFNIVKVLGLSLSVLMVSGLALAGIVATSLTAKVQTFDLGDEAAAIPQIGAYSGEINLLLVGSDTRTGLKGNYGLNPGSSLNDVNILFHMDEDHKHATVISIPRDTYVNRPACKDEDGVRLGAVDHVKINSILADGGLRCIRDTVEELSGLKIPYVGLVTFDGVVAVSNAVGGVPVCVAKRIDDDYTGLHLSKGEHNLKGAEALEFLRTRHGVGDGSDLTRISSQQVFLSSLVRTIKSSGTLTDLTKMYPLATAVAENVYLSTSLKNTDTLVSIAQAFAPIDLNQVVFIQYPTHIVGDGVEPNEASAAKLFKAIREGKGLKLTAGSSSSNVDMPGSITRKPKPSDASTPSPTPTGSATPNPTATLPSDIYGQPASQQTCSVGNNLGRR
jgi:LCP family protein required for cell wall assembly